VNVSSPLVESLLARAPLLDAARGASVVVACSGGPDSLALLALAAHARAVVQAVHVDHGLAVDGRHAAAVIGAACDALGIPPPDVRRVNIETGANLEARARDVRYAELETARAQLHATAVLVGHTMDDQAETVLLALLRGSASAGLAGMPARRGAVLRPLLGIRRAETRALCSGLGFEPLDDPMNRDLRMRRPALRHELLPRLSAVAERDLVPVLARQADVLRAESDYLDGLARAALDAAGDPPAVRALASVDPVVLRRAVRIACGAPPVSLAHVDAVIDVVAVRRLAHELPGGRTARRRDGRLVIDAK
jgi:tRNA(Ile)-lysidine synthase